MEQSATSLTDIYGEQARREAEEEEFNFIDAAYEELRRTAEQQSLEALEAQQYKTYLTPAEFAGIGVSLTTYRQAYLEEQGRLN